MSQDSYFERGKYMHFWKKCFAVLATAPLLFVAATVFAGLSSTMFVEGTVGNFDRTSVQIRRQTDLISVPRSYFPTQKDIQSGRKISLNLTIDQWSKVKTLKSNLKPVSVGKVQPSGAKSLGFLIR